MEVHAIMDKIGEVPISPGDYLLFTDQLSVLHVVPVDRVVDITLNESTDEPDEVTYKDDNDEDLTVKFVSGPYLAYMTPSVR